MSLPLRRIFHWGPIAVLGMIKLITWTMIHHIGMWWPPHQSIGGALNASVFLFLAASTLYYFLQSLFEGPGFVPSGWKPENDADKDFLQYCHICEGYKAPRSHHCRKCGRCIKKMDHHCPWINCCVGHANHCYFTKFLMAAVFGCSHATIVLFLCIYHGINRLRYIQYGAGEEPQVFLTLTTLILSLLASGMALGVVVAVGALLFLQIRSILRNRSTIEDWILEKAEGRRSELGLTPFQFPYDLGWKKNLNFLFNEHKYDGITWPLADGCGQYDLTIEQRAQKEEKRSRARQCVAVRAYSGRWLPLCRYPRAALAPLCSDEPRLRLAPGDCLRATRRCRQWLFGEKLSGTHDGRRGPRGWFPKDAVTPAPPSTPHDKHKVD